MIKKLLLLCCLFLAILYSCDQKPNTTVSDSKNDSVKKYLELASNDTLAYDKRIQYNDKAYSFIDLRRNDTLTRFNLYKVSYRYYNSTKTDSLRSTSKKLLKLSLKSNDSLNIGRAYKNLGLFYMSISENEKAIEYFFKAKKIFKSLKRMDYVFKAMDYIAYTQYFACDFLGSNLTSIEMLELSRKWNLKKMEQSALINIADNLSSLKNDSEAIKYYKKAKEVTIEKNRISGIYNSLCLNYINLKHYDTALKFINLNINNLKLISYNPDVYARSLSLNAYIQLKKGMNSNLEKKFKLAEKYFVYSNSMSCRNYNQIYLSQYYLKIKDTLNAIKAANKAVSLSKSYKNPTDILSSLEQLIKVDKAKASKNAQEYIRVNDSMQIAERNFRDKFARIAYETDEISQEKDKAIRQKWVITGIAATVILIIVLLLIITSQRTKQKELQLLQEQQKANEEIYQLMLTQKANEDAARQTEKKRIALELHDGIMNKLASTRLNLAVLSHKTDKATIDNCITQVNDIYKIEQEIRLVSHDLNQEVFQQEDSFIKIVEDFVKEQNHNHKTQFELEIDSELDWKKISSEIKMHLFRIIQEASFNISKYAQAKKATISLVLDSPNICMSITDDGIGFDTSATPKGIGIQNMKVRVKSLKGKFTINSSAKTSTSINIAIPI